MTSDFPLPESIEELRKNPSGKGVVGRAEVARLSRTNTAEALAVARRIEHPWYRCQAISSVVEANPSIRSADKLLSEALDAAYSQAEPNRVASVAFWPLRLLVGKHPELAAIHTRRLLGVIAEEPHGLRKLDGVAGILGAVLCEEALRELALHAFRDAAAVSHGWRTERIVSSTAQALAPFDREAAEGLLASRSSNRFAEKAKHALQAQDADT